MVRNQMLCIVTPDAPLVVPGSITRRLDIALRATGCVHFATLALLPPAPDGSALEAASLLFEVVVDEGIEPRAAVDMLLRAGFAFLWRLYRHAWTGPAKAGVEARRTWLRAYLHAHVEAAACGFVGARDRNVAQILAEHELLKGSRDQLLLMKRRQGVSNEELADHVIRWAERTRSDWAGEAARRSIWRRGGLPGGLRWPLLALRLGVPALAVVSLLGWLGLTVAWLAPQLGRFAGSINIGQLTTSDVGVPLLAVLALLMVLLLAVLVVGARAVEAVVVMGFFALVTLITGGVALVYLLWLREWWVVWCGAQLMMVGFCALAAALAGAAALLPLAALVSLRIPPLFPVVGALTVSALLGALTFIISYLTQGQLSSLDCPDLRWPQGGSPVPLSTRLLWIVVTSATMAAFVFATLKLLPWMNRMVNGLLRKLDRPREITNVPLHQVHPSIDACEASLIGHQSHMISLSEIRTQKWRRRARLRLCLWLINQLAEVYFTNGRLGSADGIKFGHWRIVGNGRRLLFCSNYDGAFGGYLDEFIRGASQGANLIWGCTELLPRAWARSDQPAVTQARDFPKVHLLIFRGCKYEQAFKAYARTSMLPHLHRFEAYTLSVQDIERATRLRDALCLPHRATKVDQILRALES
jgi:hypothetical protein